MPVVVLTKSDVAEDASAFTGQASRLMPGLFVEDAKQMREEIYAHHGKVFKESWLQKYFSSFDWYKADPNYNDASLTAVEKQNIATIAAYEKRAVTAASTIEG